MPLKPVPAQILPLVRTAWGSVASAAARTSRGPRRVGAWAAQPIAIRRGVHVGYFAGYATMTAVAALAIVTHR